MAEKDVWALILDGKLDDSSVYANSVLFLTHTLSLISPPSPSP
jgi:hypothetical protein